KSVFGVFPANPTDEVSKNIERTIFSFEQAIKNKLPHVMSNYRYDIPIPGSTEFEERYWTTSNTPVLDKNGDVSYFIHSPSNVTELYKLAEREKIGIEALRNQEQILYSTFMQAPVGIGIFKGPDYIVDLINPSLCEIYGKTVDEMINKPVFEVLSHARGKGFEALVDNVRLTGESYRGLGLPVSLFRNGILETVYMNFVCEPFRENDGTISGVIVVAVEITDQVIAKQKVEEAEERARLAVDAVGLGTYDLNLLTGEMFTTPQFAKIFGFDKPVPRQQYVSVFEPEDLHLRDKAHQEALISGKLIYEARVIWKDKSVHWIRVEGKVVYNPENQKPQRILGTLLDITEQIYLQRQKDDFIGIASHELKTPVTSLKAYTQVLEKMLHKQGETKEAAMVSRMDGQINRLTSLIGDLLDVTKINSGKLQFNDRDFMFNQMVRELIEDLQGTTNKHTLTENYDQDVMAYGDKERIGQVISNLITNAIKYSPNTDEIVIYTSLKNNEITLCVQDFGIGIPKDKVDKVFEQFYRVSGDMQHTFPGLGLGLYISSEIIKREGGRIWVNSSEGKGSTFCFALPVNHN
ncbi:MAG: PAS domain-containing sensor histidine kinase, partial [Daejeonella sp.]